MSTPKLGKGLTRDRVLAEPRDDSIELGVAVETGKRKDQKIKRPIFYGENGVPSIQYEIDAFHGGWRCGLEIEAGRAWMGNAIYRDLVQAMVMVQVDHLCLAVPNSDKYLSGGKMTRSTDYEHTIAVADAIYGHHRLQVPYALTVIGY